MHEVKKFCIHDLYQHNTSSLAEVQIAIFYASRNIMYVCFVIFPD